MEWTKIWREKMDMIIVNDVLRVELHSDNMDLLFDVSDAINQIVDEYYPNIR